MPESLAASMLSEAWQLPFSLMTCCCNGADSASCMSKLSCLPIGVMQPQTCDCSLVWHENGPLRSADHCSQPTMLAYAGY